MPGPIVVRADPLAPGIAQLPVFSVGDNQNWSVQFNDGANLYNPGNVTMNIGFVRGLGNLTFGSGFQWVDRMNNQHTGSFVIAAGVPGSLTWDETPIGVAGDSGAWLIRGRTPPSGMIRKVYVKYGGTGLSTAPLLRFDGGVTTTGKGAAFTATVGTGAVTAVTITNPGQGYSGSTFPELIITGDGTGAVFKVATIVGGGIATVTAVQGGSGYTTATVTVRDPEASATANVAASSTIASLLLTSPGMGYTSAPTVVYTGGGGASAAATSALANSTWGLLGFTITNQGSGYTSAPTVGFSGGTGTGAAATAMINDPAVVLSATITNFGSGYANIQNGAAITFTGGGGSGAAGYITADSSFGAGSGGIASIVITSGGAGYTSAPTMTLPGPALGAPPGVLATATAVLGDGKLASITLTNPGSGYGATAPTVAFTGGGGSAAAATALLVGSPLSPVLTVTNAGSGYTSLPVISFTGGSGSGAAAVAVNALGITSVTMTQTGYAYTSLPSIEIIPSNGALLIPSGVESHSTAFLQNLNPATSQGAITVTPYTNGRRDASGNLIYDDSLLIIRPRYLVQPTLVLQNDGLTWAAVFNPVTTMVQAVLNYRRSFVCDVEIFGGGRLLFSGPLTIASV